MLNIYEAQKYFKDLYYGQNVILQFDMDDIREINFIYTDGEVNNICHVGYNKVNIYVNGVKVTSADISPHRVAYKAEDMKKEFNKSKIKIL